MGTLLQPPLLAYTFTKSQKVNIRRCSTVWYLLYRILYRRLLRVSIGEGANGVFAPPGVPVAAGESTFRHDHKA